MPGHEREFYPHVGFQEEAKRLNDDCFSDPTKLSYGVPRGLWTEEEKSVSMIRLAFCLNMIDFDKHNVYSRHQLRVTQGRFRLAYFQTLGRMFTTPEYAHTGLAEWTQLPSDPYTAVIEDRTPNLIPFTHTRPNPNYADTNINLTTPEEEEHEVPTPHNKVPLFKSNTVLGNGHVSYARTVALKARIGQTKDTSGNVKVDSSLFRRTVAQAAFARLLVELHQYNYDKTLGVFSRPSKAKPLTFDSLSLEERDSLTQKAHIEYEETLSRTFSALPKSPEKIHRLYLDLRTSANNHMPARDAYPEESFVPRTTPSRPSSPAVNSQQPSAGSQQQRPGTTQPGRGRGRDVRTNPPVQQCTANTHGETQEKELARQLELIKAANDENERAGALTGSCCF